MDKRGGLSTSDKLAFVDSAGEVVDIDGRLYGCTVRRSECELLCAHKSSYPRWCKNCSVYLSQLRVAKFAYILSMLLHAQFLLSWLLRALRGVIECQPGLVIFNQTVDASNCFLGLCACIERLQLCHEDTWQSTSMVAKSIVLNGSLTEVSMTAEGKSVSNSRSLCNIHWIYPVR